MPSEVNATEPASSECAVNLSDLVEPIDIVQPVEGVQVKRKPGRPRKNKEMAPAQDKEPAQPKSPAEKKSVRLGCDQTARAILCTVVGGLRELVGPEWDFADQAEADGMRIALGAYLEAKGGGEMSPEIALILMTCGYAGPRFAHENTRSKFSAFFGKIFAIIWPKK